MEQKLSPSKLLSHPKKPLNVHLSRVANNCKSLMETKKIKFSDFPDQEILSNIVYLMGITHDFGKTTKYFQQYLKEKDEIERDKMKALPETKHGLFSAIFTYYAIKKFLEQNKIREKYYSYLPILSFLVVKRHHGNLGNSLEEVNDIHEYLRDKKFRTVLDSQLESIDEEAIKPLLQELTLDFLSFTEFKNNFSKILQEIDGEYDNLLQLKNMKKVSFYFIVLLLYSILIDSDKTEAMNLAIIERAEDISSNITDRYKTITFSKSYTKINRIRDEIYNEVNTRVGQLSLEDKIFSLNVPTGTGKTLTSLSFALKLRERIKKEHGFTPRIIYSLPFLSIIDQNHKIFDDVLSIEYNKDIPSNVLLKHHHLSEIFYNGTDDEINMDESQFLIEGWNSEIVVTSFIQLFHTLISNKNRSLRKFHRIVNSIVLLDEIQTIPHKYWYLLNEIITFFSNYFNTYFVLITATEPMIFDESKGEIKSLVNNKEKYFKEFNRVNLNLMINKEYSLENFEKILLKDIRSKCNKNFLIVMNTIDSSKEVFKFLKENLKNNTNEFFYLSTNVIPLHRLERIKQIKKNRRKRKIIVSTQLIEAGVDIDVDIIYRDFSPLDSINQIAGRCNRNYRRKAKGEVNVFLLKDSKTNRLFCKYIYDGFLMNKTKEVFNGRKKIEEIDFLKINNKYFSKIKQYSSDDESKKILEHLYKLAFKETGDFKLIEEDYEKIDVFIEFDEDAKKIWKKFDRIMKENIKKRHEKFLKIKTKFYSYVVSVSSKKVGNICNINGMGYIPQSDLQRKYDMETGFISEDGVFII
ncbi:MAG: CRISPR-associated helicase Cas3' [Candidatus Thermoplasmatota archaeon]